MRRRRRQLSAEKHRSETRRNSQVYIVVLQIVGKSELGTAQLVQQQEPTTCGECGITGGIKQVRRERASERASEEASFVAHARRRRGSSWERRAGERKSGRGCSGATSRTRRRAARVPDADGTNTKGKPQTPPPPPP